jgi:uncharacterized protein (TIGR02421 family)
MPGDVLEPRSRETARYPDAVTEDLTEALEIDRSLTELERTIDPLLNVTPVNASEAWEDFQRSGFSAVPTLRSRPLSFEPDAIKRRLYNLEIERVEDPALQGLFLSKRDEIMRQITMLEDRDTSRFVYESLQIYGEPSEALVVDADELLAKIEIPAPQSGSVTAGGFAEAAQRELDYYRSAYPGFDSELEVRTDVADLMVSHGRLLIPAAASFRTDRVEPLIQHEVGTHVVTYQNGRAQPLQMLAVGLPGYDETQEGLAVLAEYVSGGLDPRRMRLLAGRVIAIRRLLDGARFLDIFEELRERYSFAPRTAWGVTIRVARSGGLTKDVIYLRGIARVLEFAAERKSIDALLVGKLALEHVPLVEELVERGVLSQAWIRPRWAESGDARERMEHVFNGLSVHDLV